MSEDMLKLAARCEAATGPDRELDAAIWCALNGRDFPEPPYSQMLPRDRYKPELGEFEQGTRTGIMLQSYKDNAERYTASLDAAMTLVPEGWDRWIYDADDGRCICRLDRTDESLPELELGASALTWPLALCAAAIKARASQGKD